MASQYQPKDHIQHLEIAPRSEGVLEQREITIHSYQTTVPFDYDVLNTGLESAWLTPHIRFGVFSRTPLNNNAKDSLTVVLGLQDELSVRAYDYDNRRPLYFSWQDLIVDTVNIHYFQDKDGLLRFTTTGGGRRITDDKLNEFNASFLNIPKDAVSKRHFDLDRLRGLCFGRFLNQLYMLIFSDLSSDEYRSIDHAQFQSRKYIDPQVECLKEIRKDPAVKVESFDSDIEIHADILASPIQVRFLIRGLSGALRLRFPKISYKSEPKTVEEQARVFYRLVDVAVSSILDADYYTQQKRSLDDLDADLGMLFPNMVDLAPFREAFISEDVRERFFDNLDLESWNKWQPHLRALNKLVLSDVVKTHVAELVGRLVNGKPQTAAKLLLECQKDSLLLEIGKITVVVCADNVQRVDVKHRSYIEEALLVWAVSHEQDTWDVDPESDEIMVLNLRWQVADLSLDVLTAVLWKLVGLIHARLVAANSDTSSLLSRFNWCMTVAKGLPPNHFKLSSAFRLVADHRVPSSIADGTKVLKDRVADLQALDGAVLDQFGLPLWPYLTASHTNGEVTLLNTGIGVAIAVWAAPSGTLFSDEDGSSVVDLPPNSSIILPVSGSPATMDVRFTKYGTEHRLELPITYVKHSAKKPANKQASRDATVGALKRELHERILSLKSAIRHADDTGSSFDLPRLTQKELAAAIMVSGSSVSRAINGSDDPWLKILLQTVESQDMIRKYSR